MSTLCNNRETVRSVLVVTPASVIGALCTKPRERALAPFPSSRNVSCGIHVSPATVQHSWVTKHLVAPLSIKAENSLPLIRAGTTKRIPSSSTRGIFSYFFPFLASTTTPVNLVSSRNIYDFSFGFNSSSFLMHARPPCRQLCNALNVGFILEALPSN